MDEPLREVPNQDDTQGLGTKGLIEGGEGDRPSSPGQPARGSYVSQRLDAGSPASSSDRLTTMGSSDMPFAK